MALYFDTLRVLGWTLAGLFLLALPGVCIPFITNPNAAAEGQRAGGALGALRYCVDRGRAEERWKAEGGAYARGPRRGCLHHAAFASRH